MASVPSDSLAGRRPPPCGRGLSVLQRIPGRQRNRVVLPVGGCFWPDSSALWAAIPDVEQIQLIQRSQDHVEVRYAREPPLSPAEEHAGGQGIHQALGHPFRLTFTRQDTIARQPNGKYETFDADLPGPTGSPGSTLP
jgi:phenylacetate-CoA ligase